MVLFYAFLGGFLRRWFGGLLNHIKILGSRGVQTTAMILAFMSIYLVDPGNWKNWIGALLVSAYLQFQFWSRGHGACFDIGRDEEPTEETIARYNERWYHYVCDFLVSKNKYGFLYDFLYMGLRYTGPMIPLAFLLDPRYIFIGLLISPVYAFCWTLYEEEPWLRDKLPGANWPTQWAEIICGGIVYAGCYLLGPGQ